jgi:hypothetical protein
MSYFGRFCIASKSNMPRYNANTFTGESEWLDTQAEPQPRRQSIKELLGIVGCTIWRFYSDIRNNGVPDLSLGGNGPFPGGEKHLMLNGRITQEMALPSSLYASL